MNAFFQDLIARMDLSLPWLLPALETFDQVAPPTTRVVLCALLMAWLVMLRQRNGTPARLHRAVL